MLQLTTEFLRRKRLLKKFCTRTGWLGSRRCWLSLEQCGDSSGRRVNENEIHLVIQYIIYSIHATTLTDVWQCRCGEYCLTINIQTLPTSTQTLVDCWSLQDHAPRYTNIMLHSYIYGVTSHSTHNRNLLYQRWVSPANQLHSNRQPNFKSK